MLLLVGCANTPPPVAAVGSHPWGGDLPADPADTASGLHWQHHTLPGKTPAQFSPARQQGRDAVKVVSQASASLLRAPVQVAPTDLGRLAFSWWVPALIAQADMGERDADDAPVRVILAFDGDRSRFSAKDALLSELTRTLTGEEMPYATLMYVWCNKRESEELIFSPRTTRIRKIVVEAGPRRLGQWLDYERDIRADFERAFGESPGRLLGIAIMSDTDNTGATTTAWYGQPRLLPARTNLAP